LSFPSSASPQFPHRRADEVPHARQNLSFGETMLPHVEQSTPPCAGALAAARAAGVTTGGVGSAPGVPSSPGGGISLSLTLTKSSVFPVARFAFAASASDRS